MFTFFYQEIGFNFDFDELHDNKTFFYYMKIINIFQ